jgi:hypothetical protein
MKKMPLNAINDATSLREWKTEHHSFKPKPFDVC